MTEKVRADLRQICDVIVQTVPTVQIYLFGSYAYGEPHEDSDYDIYVVLEDEGPRPLDAMKETRRAFGGRIQMPLDILAMKESQFFYRLGAHTLEETVFQKGVLLYDNSSRVQLRMA